MIDWVKNQDDAYVRKDGYFGAYKRIHKVGKTTKVYWLLICMKPKYKDLGMFDSFKKACEAVE
jgi:hypothetical protein